MTKKKYELTNETLTLFNGRTLHRIRALRDLVTHSPDDAGRWSFVKCGDLGGWIENEENLSHHGISWVSGNAAVCGKANVRGDALVSENAFVSGMANILEDARVYGNARVCGNAMVADAGTVRDNAIVFEDAVVADTAIVSGKARVFGNVFVDGNARISGDATIKADDHFMIVGPIGKKNDCDRITFFRNGDGIIKVKTQFFMGTTSEYEAYIDKKYGKNSDVHYAVQYAVLAAYHHIDTVQKLTTQNSDN